MTTTTYGTFDHAMMKRQVERAAQVAGICLNGVWADPTMTAPVARALESAYRRGFADAEDSIAAATTPSTAAEPDSADATDNLIASAYAAAAERLAAAAKAMTEAADAARAGQRNLAIGTALGAETDTTAAKALIDAMATVARI